MEKNEGFTEVVQKKDINNAAGGKKRIVPKLVHSYN